MYTYMYMYMYMYVPAISHWLPQLLNEPVALLPHCVVQLLVLIVQELVLP